MTKNKITAVLGPTNTGKTFLAIETMLSFETAINKLGGKKMRNKKVSSRKYKKRGGMFDGFKGIKVNTQEELTEALKLSCKEQMEGITTFIEVMLNQELGEPFRRDAMKAPVEVAGIDPKDTVIQ